MEMLEEMLEGNVGRKCLFVFIFSEEQKGRLLVRRLGSTGQEAVRTRENGFEIILFFS